MDTTKNDNPIKEKVLSAIEDGKVLMRPRWHFILKATLAFIGFAFLMVALVYILSFIIFTLRESGAWYVTPFGMRGLRAFLVAVPWLLILISIILIVVLEVLVRRYAFVYRRPLLYSVVAIVGLTFLMGVVVERTPLHPGLMRHADQKRLPIGDRLYEGYGHRQAPDVHPGVVSKILDSGFEMGTARASVRVVITAATKFTPDNRIGLGERVVVFGPFVNGEIQAYGIHRDRPSGHMAPR